MTLTMMLYNSLIRPNCNFHRRKAYFSLRWMMHSCILWKLSDYGWQSRLNILLIIFVRFQSTRFYFCISWLLLYVRNLHLNNWRENDQNYLFECYKAYLPVLKSTMLKAGCCVRLKIGWQFPGQVGSNHCQLSIHVPLLAFVC